MPFRVLVVDDQTISRQLFESFIASSERYELAASVSTARYADSYCATGKVDLVLMDVVMNDGSNGLDTAQRIKKSYPEIKVIVVTSMPDSLFLTRARRIGVDSFWYKEAQAVPMLEIAVLRSGRVHLPARGRSASQGLMGFARSGRAFGAWLYDKRPAFSGKELSQRRPGRQRP